MILNGGMVTLGSVALQPRPCRASSNSNISYFSRGSYSRERAFCRSSTEFNPLHTRGWATSHSSIGSSFWRGDHGKLPSTLPVFRKFHTAHPRNRTAPRASKDVPTSFRYPAMTTKPRWWWRVLACIPYLMPLHETWMYAETAYHLHPFLEDFEFLTYPFLRVIGRLPGWFLMAYFFTAYLGIVRRKEWPHFFRFHVVMGMLLEIALQVVGSISRWMPLSVYWGKIGMHFWAAVAFGYLFTVLECIRCARRRLLRFPSPILPRFYLLWFGRDWPARQRAVVGLSMEFRNHLSHELAVPPYAEQQMAAAAADNRAALRKAMDQLSATRPSGAGEEADAVSDDGKDLHRLMAKPAMAGGSGPTWLNGAILQQHGLGQYGKGRFSHLQTSSASPGGGRGVGGGHWFPRPPPVLQRSVSEEEVPISTDSAVAAAISAEVGAGGGGSGVRAERGEAEGGSGGEAAEGTWQNARYKAEILAHPLYEQLLSAHVACLRIATPVDQLPRIDAQLAQSQQVVSKYSALGGGSQMMSVDDRELDQFMTHYVFLLSSFKEQLQQHVRVHAMEAVMACWELEQSLQSLTGVSPGEGTGGTMSDDEDDQEESDANLFDGSLDGPDSMGFGPLVPTETERSLMERVRQELKHELKQGYKDKIVDIRDEILRKRRAGKLPGDSTSTLKAWWQSHSKWPYPTEDDKARLVQETGLQLKQINNWFINQRKRNWHSNSSSSTLKSKRKRQ